MLHRFRSYYYTWLIGILVTGPVRCMTGTLLPPSPEKLSPSGCEEYIRTYYKTAIRQQRKHNIPASIILAQGVLESGAGQSYLALAGNNHFGIKCKDWKGPCICKDDDLKQEAFRKYVRVEESFEDHSRFLTERNHYRSLFKLKPTDYKAWAHGLKKCGYATDPHYAVKLIGLIEKYGLYYFDTAKETDPPVILRQSATRPAAETAVSKVRSTTKKETYAKPGAATKKNGLKCKKTDIDL
ncbi:glycoside hydrolase family 73 protein [Tannerella forsythia]|uniref:glycoside hydrolase family 73 protein n=1 Tax=Tannerella forsythia TaxID=28112 RepID=UPI003C6EA5A9